MDETEFWALIARTTPPDGAGTPEHVADIELALSEFPDAGLIDFQVHLETQAGRACTWDHWGAAYLVLGGCSDDSFDYFRCWLVAQGRDYFEAAIADPERSADRIEPFGIADCEELDYVASRAWEKRHRGDFPYDAVSARVPRRDPDIAGEPWEDDDELDVRFPELARRVADAG